MAGIEKFLKKNIQDPVSKFESLSKGKSEKEKRELEQKLLKPKPVPTYTGKNIRYILNSDFAIKLVLSSQEELDLFGKYVNITEYKGRSITNYQIISDLFKALENEEIKYDKESGKFTVGEKYENKKPFLKRK